MARKPLEEGNLVRWVSQKYFSTTQILDQKGTKVDKDPNSCELFVDTHYIDYMLSNFNQE